MAKSGFLEGSTSPTSTSSGSAPTGEFAASDAIPTSASAVRSRVSDRLAQTLYDFGEHRGKYVRLDTGPVEATLSRWTGKELPDYLRECVAAARWSVQGDCVFRTSSHVNLQELKGTKMI